MITIFVGYDSREAVGYHVFCQSVLERSSVPVAFVPLHLTGLSGYREMHSDGSNAFIYSRFLCPWLMKFKGWCVYADSDMLMLQDVANLRMPAEACAVVQHENYRATPDKYVGTAMQAKNESYPKKNWSSFIVWNCEHPDNYRLTPIFVENADGEYLHRFKWCSPESLDPRWNRLVGEQDFEDAFNYHYTLGIPGIEYYRKCQGSRPWFDCLDRVMKTP